MKLMCKLCDIGAVLLAHEQPCRHYQYVVLVQVLSELQNACVLIKG